MIKRWGVMVGVALMTTILLVTCGRTGNAPVGNQPNTTKTVQVTEKDFSIAASQTTFQPGMTYHFVVTNDSADTHEFMIGPKMPADMSMDQMHQMMLAMITQIAPHQTATLDVTFPMDMGTPMSGMGGVDMSRLEFSCHLPGHYAAGMALPITVSAM